MKNAINTESIPIQCDLGETTAKRKACTPVASELEKVASQDILESSGTLEEEPVTY